jgi:hypothetical protein
MPTPLHSPDLGSTTSCLFDVESLNMASGAADQPGMSSPQPRHNVGAVSHPCHLSNPSTCRSFKQAISNAESHPHLSLLPLPGTDAEDCGSWDMGGIAERGPSGPSSSPSGDPEATRPYASCMLACMSRRGWPRPRGCRTCCRRHDGRKGRSGGAPRSREWTLPEST